MRVKPVRLDLLTYTDLETWFTLSLTKGLP